MNRRTSFTAEYEFICDVCGEAVRVGDRAVAEFDPSRVSCVMRHETCPEQDVERRRIKTGPKGPRRRGTICCEGRACTCRRGRKNTTINY